MNEIACGIIWAPGEDTLPTFRCCIGNRHAYVSAYVDHPSSSFNWQVYAREFDERLSGRAPTEAEAKACAERLLTLPIDEFNSALVEKMTEKLNEICSAIIKLSPTAAVLPGFAAGVESERNRIKNGISSIIEGSD